jgi:hypothetical protein
MTSRDFLFEADKASTLVKNTINSHCQKHNLPVRYGFSGLEYDNGCDYGRIPYISVCGNAVKIGRYSWHKDKKLAELLSSQPLLTRIDCQ